MRFATKLMSKREPGLDLAVLFDPADLLWFISLDYIRSLGKIRVSLTPSRLFSRDVDYGLLLLNPSVRLREEKTSLFEMGLKPLWTYPLFDLHRRILASPYQRFALGGPVIFWGF